MKQAGRTGDQGKHGQDGQRGSDGQSGQGGQSGRDGIEGKDGEVCIVVASTQEHGSMGIVLRVLGYMVSPTNEGDLYGVYFPGQVKKNTKNNAHLFSILLGRTNC